MLAVGSQTDLPILLSLQSIFFAFSLCKSVFFTIRHSKKKNTARFKWFAAIAFPEQTSDAVFETFSHRELRDFGFSLIFLRTFRVNVYVTCSNVKPSNTAAEA
jgi:hypothetical protein